MWHIYSWGCVSQRTLNSGTIENKSSAALIVGLGRMQTIFRRLQIAADEMHNACLNNLQGKRRAASCVLLPNSTSSISSLSSTATGFSSRAKTTAIPITWEFEARQRDKSSRRALNHFEELQKFLDQFMGTTRRRCPVITLRGCRMKMLWKRERPRDMTHLMDFSLPYWKPYSRVK